MLGVMLLENPQNWIDTHVHADAPERGLIGISGSINESALESFRAANAQANLQMGVIPAVERANWLTVQHLAHRLQWAYALGIHPLYTANAAMADVEALDGVIAQQQSDRLLVAVGEIGLDLFVPALKTQAALAKQEALYRAQLKLGRKHSMPVVLHVRRSADLLLKHLRQIDVPGGIAHAFNGSEVQAKALIDRGFKLGFGGAMTYTAATQLRHLAATLPLNAIVLETDSPDIPPHWLYTPAALRVQGHTQPPNTPSQMCRIAQTLADLRGMPLAELAHATRANALQALPKLAGLLGD